MDELVRCENPRCAKVLRKRPDLYFCPHCKTMFDRVENPADASPKVSLLTCMTPECTNVFEGTGDSLICPICVKILEKAESRSDEDSCQLIREYLMDHPQATVDEVHVMTKVSVYRIKKFLEEGRFQLVLMPKCTRCGQAIDPPKFSQSICHGCTDSLKKQLSSTLSTSQPEPHKPPSRSASGKDRKYGFGRD